MSELSCHECSRFKDGFCELDGGWIIDEDVPCEKFKEAGR